MAYIDLEDGLPGIIGLLEYRRDTARPIRELTQILLRGESPLTAGEREMIAALVSSRNECTFCATAHTEAANRLVENSEIIRAVLEDYESAPVSEKMKALLQIAANVQKGGRFVNKEDIDRAANAGATDTEIHDTVLIAALFCLYNRYVDGLGSWTPADPGFYQTLAERLAGRGYVRPDQGYDNLKYQGK
jgi:uncharacterized peroxidase-related enzyme